MSALSYLQYFAAGFLLADLHLSEWRDRPSPRAVRWDAAGLAAAAALVALLMAAPDAERLLGLPHRWHGGSFAFLLPWLTLACFAAVLRGRILRAALTQRWVVIGGGLCYTFYLYHSMFIEALIGPAQRLVGGLVGADSEALLLYAACLVPTLLGSAALFVALEKPFMGRRPAWPARRSRSSTIPAR